MTTETLPEVRPVTLRVAAESAHLYAAALSMSPELRAAFVIETRPRRPFMSPAFDGMLVDAAYEAITDPETRERMAMNRGRKTLAAIREHMYATGQRRDQRAYWREAQRQHRAVSK